MATLKYNGATVAWLVAIVAACLWLGCISQKVLQHGWMLDDHENRIRDLEHNAIELKNELQRVEEKEVTTRIPLLPEWQDYNKEYQVQFYVVDETGSPLAAARIRSDQSGDKVATSEGGLTAPLWSKLGEKFVIEKEGYERQQLMLDQDVIARKTMSIVVILRRKDHV